MSPLGPENSPPPYRSSWEPIDLREAASDGGHPPTPTIFTREDGVALLYAGKVHSFIGEPESLKSWLALAACAEEIRAGNKRPADRDISGVGYSATTGPAADGHNHEGSAE